MSIGFLAVYCPATEHLDGIVAIGMRLYTRQLL
jgi:hypothetical protein